MSSRRPLLTPASRRFLSGLAGLLSVALVVVDAGYAPASQAGQAGIDATGARTARAGVHAADPQGATTQVDAHASPKGIQTDGDDESRQPDEAVEDDPQQPFACGDDPQQPFACGDDPQQPAEGGDDDHMEGTSAPQSDAPQPEAQAKVPPIHVVQPGETAYGIADRYGVATKALVRANRHARPEALHPGDLLVVPDPGADQPRTPQEALTADMEVEHVLEETARRYGWNPATVKAIAWYESRWNQRLVSDQEAIGVMQVQPATGELMERLLERPLDLHDLRDNVEAGVAYLDRLHGHHHGNLRVIIAAYHQGPEALRTRGIYRVSDVYTDEVLRLRAVFAG